MRFNFSFDDIKKADILLLDRNFSNLKFQNIDTKIFDYNKIFVKVLIKSVYIFLLKAKKKLKDIYLELFFSKVNAKLIIGSHADGLTYRAKKLSPNSKILVYLHTRLMNWEIYDLQKVLEKFQVDYIFAIDEIHKNILKKNVKSEFVLSGMIKNNEIFLEKEKRFMMLFIFLNIGM